TELRYMPRWFVIFIDVLIIISSILLSYLFLKNLEVKVNFPEYRTEKRLVLVMINILFMFVFKTYAGIIRHSTFFDFFKIILSSGSTLLTLLVINYISEMILGKSLYLYPNLFLYFLISVSLML